MARRLPVYLLLDVSGSMYGEPIEAVKNGVQLLVSTLQGEPYALETAYLSVITFGSEAEQIVPLTEIMSFPVPDQLDAGGCTALGEALSLLADCIDTEVAKTTATTKGDWKPLVFIMTDGEPTDDLTAGIDALRKTKIGTTVCYAVGQHANVDNLKLISENVVSSADADAASIRSFFKWVSASVTVGSEKIDNTHGDIGIDDLPPPPDGISIA